MTKVRFLNMARRLRPTTFAELKGQELALSMLKNSLYSNTFFPVYLFTGQRGCGKTTTGRIFAAALNCQKLSEFQQNPQIELPCKVCESCLMMSQQTHPDYIEMDAASHTGVDDVRSMLDAASYAPLHGTRKIYLIDEAHMLSKSAFNALLKMLEEPPKTALFMLATTEFSKVPATVRSRCFQVHFMPLSPLLLSSFLKEVAEKEGMTVDDGALHALVNASEGCVRDALNLFEQVSFATKNITQEVVHQAIGMLPKNHFFSLIIPMLEKSPERLLDALEASPLSLAQASSFFVLSVDFFRALLRTVYQVPVQKNIFAADQEFLDRYKATFTLKELHTILQLLWEVEGLMGNSHQKHLILEHFLLKIASRDFSSLVLNDSLISTESGPNVTQPSLKREEEPQRPPQRSNASFSEAKQVVSQPVNKVPIPIPVKQVNAKIDPRWNSFVDQVKAENLIMLASIFMQVVEATPTGAGKLLLVFSVKSGFFQEKIAELKNQWHPIFLKCFDGCTDFEVVEKLAASAPAPTSVARSTFTPPVQSDKSSFSQSRAPSTSMQAMIFKSPDEWPEANELLKAFPGTIEVVSTNDEEKR